MNLRVDRIKAVGICENLKIEDMEQINPAKYRDENSVMYAGETVTVEFTDRHYNEYVIAQTNS